MAYKSFEKKVTILSTTNVTDLSIQKKHYALGLTVLVPITLTGYLGVRVSTRSDGPWAPIYDDEGILIQLDLSVAGGVESWFVLKADIMPVHYLRFEHFSDAAETTPANPASDTVLTIMGVS